MHCYKESVSQIENILNHWRESNRIELIALFLTNENQFFYVYD